MKINRKTRKIIVMLLLIVSCSQLMGCKKKVEVPLENISADVAEEVFVEDQGTDNITEEISQKGQLITDLRAYVTNVKFQGSILIEMNGDILLAEGFGYADEESNIMNTENTSFEIGSVTKQFTAAAIMQLVEQGKLSVNDTIDQYFPEYPLGSKITIKNLLQMRSGIYDYLNNTKEFYGYKEEDYSSLEGFYEYVQGEVNQAVIEGNVSQELVKQLYKVGLMFEPDTRFSYSNTNYFLLGLIIEQVSQTTYQEYMKKNIFEVCGIEGNLDYMGAEAKGYSESNGNASYPVEITYAAGSICASAMDIYRWNKALYGEKIISESSLKEMTTGVEGYGYGLEIKPITSVIRHSGGTICYSSLNLYDPEKEIMVIVMTNNRTDNNTDNIGQELWKLCGKSRS